MNGFLDCNSICLIKVYLRLDIYIHDFMCTKPCMFYYGNMYAQ